MSRVFVLGAGTPTPTPHRFGSAYAVEVGGEFLMFDCGPAATHKLVKAGIFLLAMLTVLASIVGDLYESLIKRHANMKDSGDLFPGHGGMFDRLDSVFAALPVWAAGLALLRA